MRTLLFFLLLVTGHIAIARPGTLSGRVVDNAGQPLVAANIILLRAADSSLVKTELSNERGEYGLIDIANGTFVLKVTLLGYDTYTSDMLAIANNTIALPDIKLLQNSSTLKEVEVRAQKPFIEVYADKLVVNVENSIVNAGGSVLDVLSRAPGVKVDQSDNISLKGKQGVNVMINGKVQPMSAQELADMLKSMPANAVETIELITNPSARYDAAGTAGIINIKTKKDKKIGLNGSVNATYAQGVYGKGSGGFNMNYRNKKLNFYANYNHSIREGFNHLTLDRKFYENDVFNGAYLQDNHYLYHITSDQGGLGMDYNISARTVIGFAMTGDATSFTRDGRNYSLIIDPAKTDTQSHFVTNNKAPNQWNNYTANINLRHTFDSSGKVLTVDADYAVYPGTGTQDYTTRHYNDIPGGVTIESPTLPPDIFHGDITGLTQIRSFKADYTNPLPGHAKLEAGVKTSFVTTDYDLRFYNFISGRFENDTKRTNHFIYNEHINAAYINLSKDWTKWSTQAGLRAEQTIARGDAHAAADSSFTRNYVQLFPSFAVQRHFNEQNDLGMTLSRRIERPSYDQLNPSPYYLDPTTFKAGYPYLSPALSYSAELSYVYKQRFITTLNYTITQSPITEVIQPSPTEPRVTIQTQKNLISMAYYGVSGSYQFSITKWWNNTTNCNVYYAQYKGDIAGTDINTGKATFDINTNNSFILPGNWSAELGAFYQAPQVYGYMHLRPTSMINAGIQKNIWEKRATIRLNATDIFWHGYPSATSYYNDYTEFFIAKRDTRQVALSFTYRFGKRTVPVSQRHSGGAEEEKKRVGGQGG